jgi:hypothetical protein
MEMPARSAGLDRIVAEIIEAGARTMVDNDNNKQRRLVELSADLPRGGTISTVVIVDLVRTSPSPWFFGPFGFALSYPQRYSFRSCPGALRLFNWKRP